MKHRMFDVSFGSDPSSVYELRTFHPLLRGVTKTQTPKTQTSDPEKSDPEKSDPENSDPENSDLEKLRPRKLRAVQI